MAAVTGSSFLLECDEAFWRNEVDCKSCNRLLLKPCCCGLSMRDHRDHCRTCGHVVCRSESCSRVVSALKTGNKTHHGAKIIRVCDYCWLFHFVSFDPTHTDNVVRGDTFNKRQRKHDGKTTGERLVWLTVEPGSVPVVSLCWRKLRSRKTSKFTW